MMPSLEAKFILVGIGGAGAEVDAFAGPRHEVRAAPQLYPRRMIDRARQFDTPIRPSHPFALKGGRPPILDSTHYLAKLS